MRKARQSQPLGNSTREICVFRSLFLQICRVDIFVKHMWLVTSAIMPCQGFGAYWAASRGSYMHKVPHFTSGGHRRLKERILLA